MLMNQMTQMNQAQLLHWINMVSFAVVDIAEYLDTHPVDAEAICYFNHHMEMRRNAMQVYADKFGPLTIDMQIRTLTGIGQNSPCRGKEVAVNVEL